MKKIPTSYMKILKDIILDHDSSIISWINDENFYNLSIDQYNILREMVCDELIETGFEEDMIIERGIKLENLIDLIGDLFL